MSTIGAVGAVGADSGDRRERALAWLLAAAALLSVVSWTWGMVGGVAAEVADLEGPMRAAQALWAPRIALIVVLAWLAWRRGASTPLLVGTATLGVLEVQNLVWTVRSSAGAPWSDPRYVLGVAAMVFLLAAGTAALFALRTEGARFDPPARGDHGALRVAILVAGLAALVLNWLPAWSLPGDPTATGALDGFWVRHGPLAALVVVSAVHVVLVGAASALRASRLAAVVGATFGGVLLLQLLADAVISANLPLRLEPTVWFWVHLGAIVALLSASAALWSRHPRP